MLLSSDNKLAGLAIRKNVAFNGKWQKRVAIACKPEILKNPLKDWAAIYLARQHAFDVFHHECCRFQSIEDRHVFPVQKMSPITLGDITLLSGVASPSDNGVCLARGASDQHGAAAAPFANFVQDWREMLEHAVTAQFHLLGFFQGELPVIAVGL